MSNHRSFFRAITPCCLNESDSLKQVIIGYPYNFRLKPDGSPKQHEIINATQARYAGTAMDATAKRTIPEFHEFARIMKQQGIEVIDQSPCPEDANVPDQLTPRDIGFVVDDTFYLVNMAKSSRKREWEGIKDIISRIPQDKIIKVPDDATIEGGDVIIDKGNVYVGISQRTNWHGFSFLQRQMQGSEFNVIPIELKSPSDGEDCLHLDCVFLPVGQGHALIYPNGIKDMPSSIKTDYQLIPVSKQEQRDLATNVLAISPTTVISRDIATRVNAELQKAGLTVITIKFNEAPKTGGSFRCCTLPLIRG